MKTLSAAVATLALLALLAWLAWAGQQPPPDRYYQYIKTRGVLRVGIDPTYPPFDTLSSGKVAGYDADLAGAVAGDLGVRVEFVPLALDTMYDSLAAGKVDMLASALPFIYERQKDVRYSLPYYQAGQVLVARAGDNSITGTASLAGRQVGVELGSNADTEARRLARSTVKTLRVRSEYHSAEEALAALVSGDIEASITDNLSAQVYAREHPGEISVLSPPVTDDPSVLAMPAGARALAEKTNAAIERLRSSGQLAAMMGER